eukprot:4867883-Alexandrium_andersonii.AAC.1
MSASLVGSEMCIRDSPSPELMGDGGLAGEEGVRGALAGVRLLGRQRAVHIAHGVIMRIARLLPLHF